jgi:hypothetical protein
MAAYNNEDDEDYLNLATIRRNVQELRAGIEIGLVELANFKRYANYCAARLNALRGTAGPETGREVSLLAVHLARALVHISAINKAIRIKQELLTKLREGCERAIELNRQKQLLRGWEIVIEWLEIVLEWAKNHPRSNDD